MTNLYSELILEHSRYPSNYGTLADASVSHEELNPLCGDRIRIDLIIANDVVRDIKFSGEGCAISQAAASMLTEAVKGLSVEEAKAFTKDEMLELIGIPLHKNPMRLKCALLALKAFKMGLYGVGTVLDDEDL